MGLKIEEGFRRHLAHPITPKQALGTEAGFPPAPKEHIHASPGVPEASRGAPGNSSQWHRATLKVGDFLPCPAGLQNRPGVTATWNRKTKHCI